MEENGKVSLSDGEWRIMNLLWENPPQTIMELTRALKKDRGWSKNTVITMLNRLEAKSAVHHEEGQRAKQFYPSIERADAALQETKGFLERVYEGSVSLMVANSKSLSRHEIEELYEVLRKAEEEGL